MKCSECSYKNIEGTNFCQNCGVVLEKKDVNDNQFTEITSQPSFKESSSKNATIATKIWLATIFIFIFILFVIVIIGENTELSDTLAMILVADVLAGVVAFCIAVAFGFLSLIAPNRVKYSEDEFGNNVNESARRLRKSKNTSKVTDLISEDIDDVIFHGQRQSSQSNNVVKFIVYLVGIGVVLFLLFLTIEIFSENNHSNYTQTTQQYPTVFPINNLSIEDYEIIFKGEEAYFTGTLKNSYSIGARHVQVRLDFYRDQALNKHFDTRKIDIEYGADANGAFSFEVPLYIYPEGQFWWVWRIEKADYE